MPLQFTKPTGQFDANGDSIDATYWVINYIEVLPLRRTLDVTYGGYASKEAFLANPLQDPLQHFHFEYDPSKQWPLDPDYMTSNFGDAGPLAYALSVETYALGLEYFSGGSLTS